MKPSANETNSRFLISHFILICLPKECQIIAKHSTVGFFQVDFIWYLADDWSKRLLLID